VSLYFSHIDTLHLHTFSAVAVSTFYYTIRVYRRLLKYEEYQLTESAKQPSPYYNDMELGNSVTVSSGNGKGRADPPAQLDLKSEVDRHIGAGFGWSAPSGVERSSSIVSKGVVPSAKASPEHELRRSKSYHPERGVIRGEEYASDPDDDDDNDTIRGEGYRDESGHRDSKDGDIGLLRPHDDEGDEDTKALLPESQEPR
jgi:hypothetical protein